MQLEALVRRVEKAPAGPEVVAFFDYDGTVITGYSAAAFYRHRLRTWDLGPVEFGRTFLAAARGIRTSEEFAAFLDLSLASWKEKDEAKIRALGEKLFKDEIGGRLHLEVWRLLEAHRLKRHRIVLASSATAAQVDPMAREIGASDVLCTRLEIQDGRFTGRLDGAPLWAEGKGNAVRDFAAAEGIDLARSFAYANGDEDIDFLRSVGHPVAISPGATLERAAVRFGWPILRCEPRGGNPSLWQIARTAGFYGGMAAAGWTSALVGLLNRSRRQFIDFTIGIGSDLGLAFAGVDVNVRGEQHLWSARPCVFVFNHQSKIDPIIVGKLLRGGFTGVAKKEAANVPGFGQFFRFAGVAFVDRGNTAQAKAALAPAVAKIRSEGLSLAIAPEGTRTPTPRLGPFKKGPFHIAMQARVPMVAIVMRNAGEVMWRSAQTIRPGTVDVVVLPPIDTHSWRAETLDQHLHEVREMFVRTLDDWPGGTGATR
jgi:putative phosphoserine phosphatase / 1-acylglycerol-3-phosphate O-acyltransferase